MSPTAPSFLPQTISPSKLREIQQAAALLLARQELAEFACRMNPRLVLQPFHHFITEHLEALERGDIRNLIVAVPPRHGKPLAVETPVLMADGSYRPLGMVEVGDRVITRNGRPGTVRAVHEQGVLPVVKITTHGGRSVRAALDHPFLTTDGWKKAGDLVVGDTLGCVDRPQTISTEDRAAHEFRLAGYFIGDGNVTRGTTSLNARITNVDPSILTDIKYCSTLMRFSANEAKRNGHNRATSLLLSGGVREWLIERELAGHDAHTKRVPEWVFRAGSDMIANFIGAYFSCDGCVSGKGFVKGRRDVCVEFYSIQRPLLEDVQHLLLRLGIQSRLRIKWITYRGERKPSYVLTLTSMNDVAKFRDRVPVYGAKADRLSIADVRRTQFDGDLLPDAIVEIEADGEAECRCLTLSEADHPSFTANDLVVHNTELVSVNYPSWVLGRAPASKIILASYALELAMRNSRLARNKLLEAEWPFPEVELAQDSMAAGRWGTKQGGEVLAAGVGSGITGFGADYLLIDDYHRGREEADAESQRNRVWNWYREDASTRQMPKGRTVVMACLTADTRIPMSDGTWKPIVEVRPGDTVFGLDGDELARRKVLGFKESGEDEVFSISTPRLNIKANRRHPFLVARGKSLEWVRVEDLKKGDVVATMRSLPDVEWHAPTVGGRPITRDFSWLFGYLMGDGWVTEHVRKNQQGSPTSYAVCAAMGVRQDLNERVLDAIEAWFGRRPTVGAYGYARLDSNDAGRVLKHLGLTGGARGKRIPDWLWGAPKDIKVGFLLGLMAADGTKMKRGLAYQLNLCNRDLVEDVRLLALQCGVRPTRISSRITINRPPHSPAAVEAESHRTNLVFNDAYGDAQLSPGGRRETVRFERIVDIRSCGREKVYDLAVEGENFVAEGFVVHNTRWHEDDLIGRILNQPGALNEWVVITLPAVAMENDPVGRSPGEALDPARYPLEELERLRSRVGPRGWSALYQQSPVPQEGNLVKTEWWQHYDYDEMRKKGLRPSVMAIDPAFGAGSGNDYSVAAVWGTLNGRFYLIDLWRKRVTYPELRQAIGDLYRRYRVPALIEDIGAGRILINEMRGGAYAREDNTAVPTVPFKLPAISTATGGRMLGKRARVEMISNFIEGGLVFLPESAPWLRDFIEEHANFPAGQHDDMVDTTVMALIRLSTVRDEVKQLFTGGSSAIRYGVL